MRSGKMQMTEEEPMITIKLTEWLRMDREIKRLGAALKLSQQRTVKTTGQANAP